MLFTGILVHIYMAFWVKGSIRGIVEGWVTVRWAKNTTQDGIVKKFYQNLRKIYSTSNLAKQVKPKSYLKDFGKKAEILRKRKNAVKIDRTFIIKVREYKYQNLI